jgi:hypothetical protein
MTTSDENFTTEQPAREQAIEHIGHRRRYRTNMAMAFFALLIALLAAGFWAMIFYPDIAWVFLISGLGLGFCPRYLSEPISERQIKREIERQAHSTH